MLRRVVTLAKLRGGGEEEVVGVVDLGDRLDLLIRPAVDSATPGPLLVDVGLRLLDGIGEGRGGDHVARPPNLDLVDVPALVHVSPPAGGTW